MGSSSLSVDAAPLFLLPPFHLLFTLADTHSAPAAQPAQQPFLSRPRKSAIPSPGATKNDPVSTVCNRPFPFERRKQPHLVLMGAQPRQPATYQVDRLEGLKANEDSPITYTYAWGHTQGSRPARSEIPRYTKRMLDLWLPGEK